MYATMSTKLAKARNTPTPLRSAISKKIKAGKIVHVEKEPEAEHDQENEEHDDNVEQSGQDSDIEIEFNDESDADANDQPEDPPASKSIVPKKKVREEQELDRVMLDSLRNNDDDETVTVVIPKKVVSTKGKTKATPIPTEAEEDVVAIADSKTKKPRKKATTTKTTGAKKGPGRPRKTPKKEPIPRKGISKTATNPDDHIEVLYEQPVLLRKIFQFFKSLAAAQIQILFRPKDIIFYAEDHHKKSKIRVRLDATKLNHYYCKSTLDVGVASKDLELILNKVDKEYSSIVLLSNLGSTQRNITLVLENDIQIDEMHTIDLVGQYDKMENESDFVDEDYMIKFQFPSKYFRKTINDIKTMSSQLSITQEDAESSLVFEYLTNNKKIQSKHTVKDNNKIKLVSELAAGDSFRVDVKIDYIKPISAAQIADEVTILVDENKAFMTKAYIDNETIEIKTLTEIIDDRPEEEEDPDD
jgi:hypothetical protein